MGHSPTEMDSSFRFWYPAIMKTVLKCMAALGVTCLVAALVYFIFLPPRIKGTVNNIVLPGTETTNLDHLHPDMRTKIDALLHELRQDGHRPRIAAAYRSPERQRAIRSLGQIASYLGLPPSTMVTKSCHNHRHNGKPASLAIDIWGGPVGPANATRAKFFHALREGAAAQGLESGGNWTRRNKGWSQYDLGWDPAHVQMPNCMSMVNTD